MLKEVVLLLCALVAVSQTRLLKPRDIIDQVNDELDVLKSIVEGDILAAHNDLDSLLTEFQANSQTLSAAAEVQLQQQHENIQGQLGTLKALAESAEKDITTCLDVREELLNRLAEDYRTQMNNCISLILQKVEQILRDARYIVDVVINKVNDLEYQVKQCDEDLLCLSPLLTEIQLNKIRLPQNIATEVQAAETLVDLDRISTETCSDNAVSEYTSQSYSILSDITDCAIDIINSK